MASSTSTPPSLEGDSLEAHHPYVPDALLSSYIPHQDPITIALDATTIISFALVAGTTVHFIQPLPLELAIVAATAVLLVYHDYRNFINLGPGGTPSTLAGYLRVSWYRLWSLRNTRSLPASSSLSITTPTRGILAQKPLPSRAGPRPVVAGIIPHRQLDQRGPDGPNLRIRRTLGAIAAEKRDKLMADRSCFEKHGLGLFALRPVNETCQGEILHVHPSERSMHMNLHPEDIGEILDKGWGERHPLAKKAWFGPMPVPETFVLVYAPRDDYEVEIVCRIIEAAIWFVTAEEMKLEVM